MARMQLSERDSRLPVVVADERHNFLALFYKFIPLSQIMPLGPRLAAKRYSNPNQTVCVAYRNYLSQLAQLLGLDSDNAASFADTVWSMETKLAQVK